MALYTGAFEEACRYLETLKPILHPSQVRAAMKRITAKMFDLPQTRDEQMQTLSTLLWEVNRVVHSDIVRRFITATLLEYMLACQACPEGYIFEARHHEEVYLTVLKFLFQAQEYLVQGVNQVQTFLLEKILDMGQQVEEFHWMTHGDYAQTKTMARVETFKEELIQRACHPSRMQWILDEEEKREIFG